METFESTEMVPGRTARRARLHCFCEIDLMPGGSRNCIFEGAGVREKAISALIVSLFTHLQKPCLKQTQFIYSNSPSAHKRKLVLRLGASTCSTSSSGRVDLLWRPTLVCGDDANKKSRLQQAGRDYWPRYCCVKMGRRWVRVPRTSAATCRDRPDLQWMIGAATPRNKHSSGPWEIMVKAGVERWGSSFLQLWCWALTGGVIFHADARVPPGPNMSEVRLLSKQVVKTAQWALPLPPPPLSFFLNEDPEGEEAHPCYSSQTISVPCLLRSGVVQSLGTLSK